MIMVKWRARDRGIWFPQHQKTSHGIKWIGIRWNFKFQHILFESGLYPLLFRGRAHQHQQVIFTFWCINTDKWFLLFFGGRGGCTCWCALPVTEYREEQMIRVADTIHSHFIPFDLPLCPWQKICSKERLKMEVRGDKIGQNHHILDSVEKFCYHLHMLMQTHGMALNYQRLFILFVGMIK